MPYLILVKDIGWAVFERNCLIPFLVPPLIFWTQKPYLASETSFDSL